jgi:acyl carrier protein
MVNGEPRDENAILSELTPVFRKVFDDEKLTITLTTTANDVDGWDSLTHMNLITSIERHYGIKFRLADIIKFRNVGDLCRAILRSLPQP